MQTILSQILTFFYFSSSFLCLSLTQRIDIDTDWKCLFYRLRGLKTLLYCDLLFMVSLRKSPNSSLLLLLSMRFRTPRLFQIKKFDHITTLIDLHQPSVTFSLNCLFLFKSFNNVSSLYKKDLLSKLCSPLLETIFCAFQKSSALHLGIQQAFIFATPVFCNSLYHRSEFVAASPFNKNNLKHLYLGKLSVNEYHWI